MKLPTLNPYLILGVVLSHLALGSFVGWKAYNLATERAEAKQLSDKDIARTAADAVAAVVVDAVKTHKGSTQVIHNKAVETIKENTIYAECKLPEDMQALIQAAGERSD